jgi:hypothetical protein
MERENNNLGAEQSQTTTMETHEEFCTISPVSQWGSRWLYIDDAHLREVRTAVSQCRSLGISQKVCPRLVHNAQLLIWRFYLKETDFKQYPTRDIIGLAFECSIQLLDRIACRTQVNRGLNQLPSSDGPPKQGVFKKHFEMLVALDFEIGIPHPSDYLEYYITMAFTGKYIEQAETIIADSFLCPVCLVHTPPTIAEGAAIMAAAMLGAPSIVQPKTVNALAFIQEMKTFYLQSLRHK